MHRAVLSMMMLSFASMLGCSAGGSSSPAGYGGSNAGAGGGQDASAEASGGTAGSGGQEAGPNPCEGVNCYSPPANECDGDNLKTYNLSGACDSGECFYGFKLLACPYGCENGACIGDACLGVTCVTPPANYCADPSHLNVHDVPGTCTNGACQYDTHAEYCDHGCEDGGCTGNPCAGVSCATPPAGYCADATHMAVFDATGTCDGGTCTYPSHNEFCEFGCASSGSGPVCNGNPCAGIACATPPAAYCPATNTARVYEATGTCANGDCTYPSTDVACTFGCVNGACRECNISQDCVAGEWCDGGQCKACNTDDHCGATCSNCTTSSQVCNAGSTACVQCVTDAHCGSGKWCDTGTCRSCDNSAHCGASCAVCSGQTPTCNGYQCVCEGASCGAYNLCVGGACSFCDGNANCGSSCTACASPTPYCTSDGSTSHCVECQSQNDCTGGKVCSAEHACVDPGCPPPVESCTTGTQNRSGCANARIIGRKAAAVTAGYKVTDTLCSASDKFDDSTSCWDAGPDHAYRIYLRQGEKINISMTTGTSCINDTWYATIKVFSNAGCGDTSCATKVLCDDQNTSVTKDFTATQDGWYILTAEGSSAFDDEGAYTYTVKLTCNQPGCECL